MLCRFRAPGSGGGPYLACGASKRAECAQHLVVRIAPWLQDRALSEIRDKRVFRARDTHTARTHSDFAPCGEYIQPGAAVIFFAAAAAELRSS